MIKILGTKRILTILIALMINAGLGAHIYFNLIPETENLDRSLRKVRTETSKRRNETLALQNDYQSIQDRKLHFDNLSNTGFFTNQNRVIVRDLIEAAQTATGIISADYNISPAEVEESETAKDAGHLVLNSPVSISIEALDDIDIYRFIYWLENTFPGHVSLTHMNIERNLDINEAVLRHIGSGSASPLVTGDIDFEWRTMVPGDKDES